MSAGRLAIPAAVVRQFEKTAAEIGKGWTGRADAESLERVKQAVGRTHPVRSTFDFERSLRLARRHSKGPVSCYWSSRDALVSDRDLRGAMYTEGVAVWSWAWGSSSDVLRLGLELEGWLTLPTGEIVDVISPLADPKAGYSLWGARTFYVPVRSYPLAAVAAAPLPRLMHSAEAALDNLAALADVMTALHGEIERRPALTMRRALRVALASTLALSWWRNRGRQYRAALSETAA